MPRFAPPLALLLLAGLVLPGFAQRGRLPQVGSTLPNVSVYDENGKAFSTQSLRGHYSVLVFGCLT